MSRLSAPEFHNEQAAFMHFESIVWPDGARCPHCRGAERLNRLKGKSVRSGLWECCRCRKQFTAKIGTFFEGSRLPMTKWLQAIYLIASSKRDIPACQLQRILDVQYNTAWFIVHRLRVAKRELHTEPVSTKAGLSKRVETDLAKVEKLRRKGKH
jgi:transposase-like protein